MTVTERGSRLQYNFKTLQELFWVAFVAAALFALQTIEATERIDDMRTWGIALGGGAVRAAVGAVLAAWPFGGRSDR